MKPSNWNQVPGPPSPELPNDPRAIEEWVSELMRQVAAVANKNGELLETAQGVEERQYRWGIRDGCCEPACRWGWR